MNPYKKSGILRSSRHKDNEILSGVTYAINVDVPDIPLSFVFHFLISSYNKFIDLIPRGYRLIFYDVGIG